MSPGSNLHGVAAAGWRNRPLEGPQGGSHQLVLRDLIHSEGLAGGAAHHPSTPGLSALPLEKLWKGFLLQGGLGGLFSPPSTCPGKGEQRGSPLPRNSAEGLLMVTTSTKVVLKVGFLRPAAAPPETLLDMHSLGQPVVEWLSSACSPSVGWVHNLDAGC